MGNLRYKIELILGRQKKTLYQHTVFALFACLLLLTISKYKSAGAYIRRGDLTEAFKRFKSGRFIFGGASP